MMIRTADATREERAMTGSAGQGSKSELLRTKALALASSEKIPYAEALVRVGREEPELVRAAREETLGPSSNQSPNYTEWATRAITRANWRGISIDEAMRQIEEEEPALVGAARKEWGMRVKETRELPNGLGIMYICASEVLAQAARALAIQKNVGSTVAMREVLKKNPELGFRVCHEISGAKPLIDPNAIGLVLALFLASEVDTFLDYGECLAEMAKRRCKGKDLSLSRALSEVSREHPELSRLARAQVIRGKRQ
jgi:hypothetical protein